MRDRETRANSPRREMSACGLGSISLPCLDTCSSDIWDRTHSFFFLNYSLHRQNCHWFDILAGEAWTRIHVPLFCVPSFKMKFTNAHVAFPVWVHRECDLITVPAASRSVPMTPFPLLDRLRLLWLLQSLSPQTRPDQTTPLHSTQDHYCTSTKTLCRDRH